MRASQTGVVYAALVFGALAIATPRRPALAPAVAVVPAGPLPMALAFVLGGGLFGAAVLLQRRRRRRAALVEHAVWERTRALVEVNRTLELSLARMQQAQARLLAADRLASLGSLAASVAHELNNPLAFVTSNLRFVKGELEVGSGVDVVDLTVALGEALEGADRMAEIIRDLRRLSRCDCNDAGQVDLLPLLDAAANVTFGPVRSRASLVKDFRPVPKVALEEARLGQVFLNLLLNAVQSLPSEPDRAPEVRVATWTCPDGRAAVEIGDNGAGLTEDQRVQVFEAFITDRLERVGLAISETLVREAGGEIEVSSRPGLGTRFRVLLPPAKPPARVAAADANGVVIVDEARPKAEASSAS